MIRLQRDLWCPDLAANSAYLAWKYEQNPYTDGPRSYLALDGDEVVGMRGLFGVRWEVGVQPAILPCIAAGDVVVARAHRRRGLFRRLTEAALEDLGGAGYRYAINTSARPVTFLGMRDMGWRVSAPVEIWRRDTLRARAGGPLRRAVHRVPLARRYVGRGTLPFLPATDSPFAALDAAGARPRGAQPIAIERAPRPEAMTALIARIGHDGRLRHVRDGAYFAWRYRDPLRRYRFLFWDEGGVEGYLVLQAFGDTRRPEVSIVDWEATGAAAREGLLRAVLEAGRFDSIWIWTVGLPPDQKALLRACGFRPEMDGEAARHQGWPGLLLMPLAAPEAEDLAAGERPLLDPASWDLRMIYSDRY